jgi:hypothetical protein
MKLHTPRLVRALALSALAVTMLSAGGYASAAVEEPIDSRFVAAVADPLRGDWQGASGYVAQLILLDGGQVQATVFRAFDVLDNKPVAVLKGTRDGATAKLSGDGWTATIAGGHFKGQNGSDKFDLERVTRGSPTMGAKPPAGAIVLFDGRNADAWATKDGKNWLQEAPGPASAKIVDGALELIPGTGGGLISHKKFGDAHFHVEFRTLGSPSNSGVFLQTRYEADINESYGKLDANPNGNLGNCTPPGTAPNIRPTHAVLEWNTFDIDFQAPKFDAAGKKTENAHVTLFLNGVKVYDRQDVAPAKGAAGRFGEAATGPLYLQEHGMPVQFRNIWAQEK